jgi:hypothetical protein
MTSCLINEVNPGRTGIPISKSRDLNNPENPEIQIPGFDNPEIGRDPGMEVSIRFGSGKVPIFITIAHH